MRGLWLGIYMSQKTRRMKNGCRKAAAFCSKAEERIFRRYLEEIKKRNKKILFYYGKSTNLCYNKCEWLLSLNTCQGIVWLL